MFIVDPSLPTPPYEQLKDQIIEQRTSGTLLAGQRLPPVRQLATELGLAPNTVARAYRELEASGIIETRGRAGSFITGTAASSRKAARAAAVEYAERVRALNVSPTEALALVRQALSSEPTAR